MLKAALPPSVSRPWIAVATLAWICALGLAGMTRPEPLPPGELSSRGVLATDPMAGRAGWRAIASTPEGEVLLESESLDGLLRGVGVEFQGVVDGPPGRIGAHRYRGIVEVDHLESVGSPPLLIELGQGIRERVSERASPAKDGKALLAGFLIGDTTGLTRTQLESMRRAGLSHFVAVSGSNVALFVGLLVFLAGPLALGPKRRALVGLLGLPVYAAATRFEPSVMRASVMAGLAFGGRLIDIVFEAWQLLSLAIIILVLVQPSLTLSAGFQLSVAATAGVLLGARWPMTGGRVGRALAVTLGAQVAVAPLILVHFGSVPLLSPLVNIVAAPIVAASTLIGAVGVMGSDLLFDLAALLANAVLKIAAGSAAWPQLTGGQLALLLATGGLAIRWPRSRHVLAVGGAALLLFTVLGVGKGPPDGSVIVLDVGQGDAILIHGGDGAYALVDGGPDELVLLDRLRTYGVDRLDLVVLSHVHADHATGLVGLVGRMQVDRVWLRAEPHETPASVALIEALTTYGVPIEEPEVGDRFQVGDLILSVEGPLRRYASPNDQSIVIEVQGESASMLLSGDVEVVAQRELGHLRADVLKVPHQGGATSDPEWLASVGARTAVISVGPNQFGHPADWVIRLLEDAGARVLRTDRDGDVLISLS